MKSDDPRIPELQRTEQRNLSVSKWMKRDWNKRADADAMFFVRAKFDQTEKEFWAGNKPRDEKILGIKTPRFEQIIKDKNPKNMSILEIGCGIGRILIPMSEIFGEVTGVDISEKMIQIAKKYLKDISNCKVLENNGSDLSMFPDDYFDFCYSIIVFQHVPEKEIVANYIQEVSRVLKTGCIFRFQVHGDIVNQPKKFDTWNGVRFTSLEIHKLAKENNFSIIEESGINTQYYWLTFKSIK